MFTISQLSRDEVSTLTGRQALEQAHKVLVNNSGRVALLFGQSSELYALKTDYSTILVTPSYGAPIELTREHVLSIGYQYGQLTIGLNTWLPAAGTADWHGRYRFAAQGYVFADQNLKRQITTEVKSLSVNGREYEDAAAIKALLEDYGYGDDFTFFGWAAASLATTTPDFTVFVYRHNDGWLQTRPSAFRYQGLGVTSYSVGHHFFEDTVRGEVYSVMNEFGTDNLTSLGKPLTVGQYRQLQELTGQLQAA